MADVIFGNKNPAGRLPITFYKSTDDLPPFDDYSMQGRTYRFFEGNVQFPFGYGLSYSSYEYLEAKIDYREKRKEQPLTLIVNIKNTSLFDGEEVIQVYSRTLNPAPRTPNPEPHTPSKSLIGFKRVFIPAGKTIAVKTPLSIDFMKRWDIEKQEYVLCPGQYEFLIGASSEDIRVELTSHLP